MPTPPPEPSFFARLGLAFRVLGNASLAAKVAALETAPAIEKPVELPPEKVHASGLAVLGLLQREGRLIDFLKEDVGSFSDAEIGAAARVVHAGCRKLLTERVTITPVRTEAEGERITLAPGYDANAIRVVGNVKGEPPYTGTLVHKGWRADAITLPTLHVAHEANVLAQAEIELP